MHQKQKGPLMEMGFHVSSSFPSELAATKVVPEEGVEPTRYQVPLDFESSASASSATPGLFQGNMHFSSAQPSLTKSLLTTLTSGTAIPGCTLTIMAHCTIKSR